MTCLTLIFEVQNALNISSLCIIFTMEQLRGVKKDFFGLQVNILNHSVTVKCRLQICLFLLRSNTIIWVIITITEL